MDFRPSPAASPGIAGVAGETPEWILIVILILMLVGAIPTWPHSRNWGYYPSGGLGLVLLILIILLLLGRI